MDPRYQQKINQAKGVLQKMDSKVTAIEDLIIAALIAVCKEMEALQQEEANDAHADSRVYKPKHDALGKKRRSIEEKGFKLVLEIDDVLNSELIPIENEAKAIMNAESLRRVREMEAANARRGRGSTGAVPCPPPLTGQVSQSPCGSSTLAVKASGPPRRQAPLGRLTQDTLRNELETLRKDLDTFWREEFASHGWDRRIFSPQRLVQCAERNCTYHHPSYGDPGGSISYDPQLVLDWAKRYGRVSLVVAMAHEFGHNAQYNSRIKYGDPWSEFLADRLAGAYVAHLHSQGIILSDRPFYGAGKIEPGQRSPCPDDDMRAFQQFMESIGDSSDISNRRRLPWHGFGGYFHGNPAERWREAYEGYRNGIPPELFR